MSAIQENQDKKEIICSTCHIKFQSVQNYKLHLLTEFHIYNTKRRIAELPPITEDVFELKKSQMVSANASAMSEVTYKCQPCSKSFKSLEQLDEHKKSKKHRRNEKEYLKQHPTMSESSIFKSISHNVGETSSLKSSNILDELKSEIDSESMHLPDAQRPESEHAANLTALDNRMTSLKTLRCCLFCDKEHTGVKKCLDHMRQAHSFTILDIDCLVDLKGLLGYISERIHLGHLCLFCSKQFADGRRCQQHMLDKSHCVMNMEDEDEYVDFYDFSKTYENHPLMIKGANEDEIGAIKEEGDEKEGEDADGGSDGGWEDCDMEDDPEEDAKGGSKSSEGFSVVDKPESSSNDFSIVDKPASSTLENIDSDLGIDSLSTQKETFEKAAGKGKTREEVFLGLRIKKAELLDTGEVRLGNGKIMGHRQFHYIYKQKPRLPDEREAVLINKMALEYRKLYQLQNGGKGDQLFPHAMTKLEFKDKKAEYKLKNYNHLKIGFRASTQQHFFLDPTAHL